MPPSLNAREEFRRKQLVINPSRNRQHAANKSIKSHAPRLALLATVAPKAGLQLIEREAGKILSPGYPGLIVKDSYWRWSNEIMPATPSTSSSR